MRIDLLRHGATQLGHTLRGSTDDALTEQGWQQMQQTVAQASTAWQIIFTSPLQRCQRFAEDLAQQLDISCHIIPTLQEMHFGSWEGQTTQHLYEKYPEDLAKFWQTPTQFTPPQAESLQAFAARIKQSLCIMQQVMQSKNLQHALVVTHGGVIKYLKCRAQAQPLDLILTMSAELAQLHSFEWHEQQLLEVKR